MKQLETFFKLVYGKNEGVACLAFVDFVTKKFQEQYFNYPTDISKMASIIDVFKDTANCYFCPQLLSTNRRIKDNVIIAPTAYSDLDSCDPALLKVEPSIIMETSPGRYQGLWILNEEVPPVNVEYLSKRIAYAHKEDGADTSGWDLTQLLRVPFTYNFKYSGSLALPVVQVTKVSKDSYSMDAFSMYPTVEKFDKILSEPMPEFTESGESLVEKYGRVLPQSAISLFNTEPAGSWSHALWQLEVILCESGLATEEVFAIARDSKCNKYDRDGRPIEHLWAEVLKAKVHTTSSAAEYRDLQKHNSLLTKDEVTYLQTAEDTFVDEYVKWASSVSDAARQYHQAGAFVIMSSVCSGSVVLPTSFGNIIPNLWFMVLGDTTLTRKSTSMDMAMELLEEIMPDAMVATDGSVEGLFTAMATRPGESSVFLRDEFSGLLEAMVKKDYMAGTAEMLTKLYDGKHQKRILRKDTIDVKDPRLIIFAGGIKNKVTSLVKDEHVSSGFLPRFVFITAISDVSKLRPVGPPTSDSSAMREYILNKLSIMYARYNMRQTMQLNGNSLPIMNKPRVNAELTKDAWLRYNELETTLVTYGLNSEKPAIYTPVGDRLAKSILKAAVLIACANSTEIGDEGEDKVIVTLHDLLVAIKYGESWLAYSYEIISNIGNSEFETLIRKIMSDLTTAPAGLTRARIMRNYQLSSRDANMVLTTMRERNMIQQVAIGGGVKYAKL